MNCGSTKMQATMTMPAVMMVDWLTLKRSVRPASPLVADDDVTEDPYPLLMLLPLLAKIEVSPESGTERKGTVKVRPS